MQKVHLARHPGGLLSCLVICSFFVSRAPAQLSAGVFTLEIDAATAAPRALVSHGDIWRYRPGTNYPGAGWQTNGDATLDSTWLSGPGGFGYADNVVETALCQTSLAPWSNQCTTVYFRRSFEITNVLDPAQYLSFTMDWDDGFVAYLNGEEIAREMTTNGVGEEPVFNARSAGSHESSRGNNPPLHPPKSYDLGPASAKLRIGTNVLAVIGINNRPDSSDFVQIADLSLSGGTASAVNGAYFSLVTTNLILLSGSNTVPSSARVVVNGIEGTFNPAQGTWSKTQALNPGMNRLFIAALDAQGAILASTNRDIVAELATVNAGGILPASTAWTSSMGVVRLTSNLVVGANTTLSIGEGVVVLVSTNAGILARTNGAVEALGTAENPIFFLPADGTTLWGELSAHGTNASLMLRQVELVGGQVRSLYGGSMLAEDSIVRDFPTTAREMVAGVYGGQLTLRRSYFARYGEIDSSETPYLAEDCLLEHPQVDGMDVKSTNANVPLVIRRTTLRFGHGSNTDALDLGPGRNTTIERCLAHDWPDKGVSLGDNAQGTVVRGCLFYSVGKGIEVYNSSSGIFSHNTIVGCSNGLHLFQKTAGMGGGIATATNNILWDNLYAIAITNNSSLAISYSDIEGGGFSGEGNIDADPLFLDAEANDYRLSAGSPARGTGLGGVDMGAIFPVGGIPARPLNLAVLGAGSSLIQLNWQDDSENETGFLIERSTNGATWEVLATAPANATHFTDSTAILERRYFYRVCATNESGGSRWSNPASGVREALKIFVGGRLTNDTVWSPAMGRFLVCSNLIVPTNITLSIEAGTLVQLTNTASLIAETGGVIRIIGAWDNRVVFERWNGVNNWGELRAEGANSRIEVHFADISGGQTTVYYEATALLEDTYFHDFHQQGGTTLFNQPLVLTHHAGPCTVRRCHFNQYYETLWRSGLNVIEDTLFENVNGDALDFDTGLSGSVIRRCTFGHGPVSNVDAIDLGNEGALGSQDILIEDCHMYDFPFDKGISIGENSFNITVRNCLIHHVSKGVQVKDVSTVNIYNCTITDASIGIHGYEKFAGTGAGRVTNSYNNILWGNTNAIVYSNTSIMVVNYTDLQGADWPGTGNISSDPLFSDAAGWDWTLQPGSPCLGTGREGANMGVSYPVGIFIPAPAELTLAGSSSSVSLSWRDNSPSEAVFEIERSVDAAPFTKVGFVPLNTTSYEDANVSLGHIYRYRVRGVNINTNSEYSREAAANLGGPVITLQPASRVESPGGEVSFTVEATGLEPLLFAWEHNGLRLDGETNAILTLPAVQAAQAGDYVAVVTDASGQSATSAVARLTVTIRPQIMILPALNGLFTAQFAAPSNITFVVEASNNLLDWLPLQTNGTGSGQVEFMDLDANFVYRFYRILLRP